VSRPACGAQRLVWLLYASGRQWGRWVPCGRWGCSACAHRKFVELTVHLAACVDKAWVVHAPPVYVRAVRHSARGDDGLRVGLADGSLYLINGRETSGYAWRTESVPVVDLAAAFAAWPHAIPERVVWTGTWRPRPTVRSDDDTVILRYVFDDDEHLRTTLRRAGVPVRYRHAM
jgi:hypothetical protein